MNVRRAAGVAVVAGLALAVSACGGSRGAPSGGAPSGGGQTLTVKGLDSLKFEPATLNVKAGQPIAVNFQSGSAVEHTFTIQQGADKPVDIKAAAGKTASGTFTIPKAGSYKYICTVPGHEAAGMVGTITVS